MPEDTRLTPQVEIDNIHQRHTTDVYEHALTITARQQIYDQLHPGQFRGEFTEILLDEIQVFREFTGLALRQSCVVWPNSFWFGIPAARGEQGFIGSQCLGRAESPPVPAVRSSSSARRMITPSSGSHFPGGDFSPCQFPAPPGASAAYATQPVSAGSSGAA
ncbi:hypothetical protein LNP25_31675 [Klebsiella variicola subsp. variicola]|nr:hypothetical protein [Klebsiella variicola subsp. variicola]